MTVRPMIWHAVAVSMVSGMVMWIGGLWAISSRPGVYTGALVAGGYQIAAFSALGLGILRDRQLIAFLMQMVGRFAVLVAVAFVLVPGLGLGAAPTLLSLVTVFFITTMLEPVFMHTRLRTGS
ncbi:MAG TPA: hypothetical protein VFI91_12170 [Longimicrobiaceae bacterium]|nr:hypothetical protein [Longimicrobiaceae bacterium]